MYRKGITMIIKAIDLLITTLVAASAFRSGLINLISHPIWSVIDFWVAFVFILLTVQVAIEIHKEG